MNYLFDRLEHLYIHWPFCHYKCHFCDFVAMASHQQFMQQYHDAMKQEIEMFCKNKCATYPLKTMYFGGGTPSTYPPDMLLDTFAILRRHFIFDETTEVTIEVNPGFVGVELLQLWKQLGINRLSIGVQSLNDQVLKSLNRHQTKSDVYALLSNASKYFDNISVDFIIGLPGINTHEWQSMIVEAMAWPIKHISMYFLMVQENTPLYFKVQTHKVTLPLDDETVDLYEWAVNILQQNGFERYEVSNFAKPGFESRHNIAYWQRKLYRGFGLGACSFNGTVRFQNTKNLGLYISKLGAQETVVEDAEILSKQQIALEKVMLGLRQRDGLSVVDYVADMGDKQQQDFCKEVDHLERAGFLQKQDGVIRLTSKGYAIENEITLRLFSE